MSNEKDLLELVIHGNDTVANYGNPRQSDLMILKGDPSQWESYNLELPDAYTWEHTAQLELVVFYVIDNGFTSDIGFDLVIQPMTRIKEPRYNLDFGFKRGQGVKTSTMSKEHTGAFRAMAIPIPKGFLLPKMLVRFSLRRRKGNAQNEVGILSLRLQELENEK